MRLARTLLIAGCLGAASAPPSAAFVSFSVGEDTLNSYLDATPEVSGGGRKTFYTKTVCWDGLRPHTCRKPVVSGDYDWSLSDMSLSVESGGVSFSGRLRASYKGLSYATDVSGDASLRLDGDRLVFEVGRVVVPIRFNVPVVGDVTVAKVPVHPNAEFSERVGVFSVETAAGDRLIGTLLSPELTLHDGRISFSGVAVPSR